MSQTPASPQGSLDNLPLADRLRWLLAVRVGVVVLLPVAAWVITRAADTPGVAALVVPGVVLLAVGLVLQKLSAFGRRWAVAAITVPVILDAVHLGWALYVAGGISGPVVYVIVLHVICVTLLGSFRTGLKLALWHSLVVMSVLKAVDTALLPAHGTVQGFDSLPYGVFLVAVWVTAMMTSGLGAVNERELRRRRYDEEALRRLAGALHEATPAPRWPRRCSTSPSTPPTRPSPRCTATCPRAAPCRRSTWPSARAGITTPSRCGGSAHPHRGRCSPRRSSGAARSWRP